jgi:ADP-ribose pyrophosphatase YjhB (NUDIX family)
MTYEYKFPMAGVTATMVLYRRTRSWKTLWCSVNIEVLLGKRGDNSDAYPGVWSLPGGYLNAGTEVMVEVASRETEEETTLVINKDRWNFFYNDDASGTDPRYVQVINLCYSVPVTNAEYKNAKADDDLSEVIWVPLKKALNYELAFAHNLILSEFVRKNT